MNQSIPLWGFLAALAGIGALYLVYRMIRAVEAAVVKIDLVEQRLVAAGQVLDLGRAQLESVPRLLEAVAKVGATQLDMLQSQRAAQSERERNPFGRSNGPAAPRDVEAANLEHEVDQMVRSQGISREEALLRMNSANESGVWGGILKGWR